MINRNHTRVLSDQQIKDITSQVATDLVKYKMESAESLVDHYLRGDAEGLLEIVSNWIELAEDTVLEELNTQLNEDSFKQTEQDNDYDY
jgi:hypothetical protein